MIISSLNIQVEILTISYPILDHESDVLDFGIIHCLPFILFSINMLYILYQLI
mgnify:CR=1 FL=1|jgi:hypothetical protein